MKDQFLWNAKEGKGDEVERLLKKGVPIEATDEQGNTALMLAAAKAREYVVSLLLTRGAALEAKNKNLQTALGVARTQRIKELLKQVTSDSQSRIGDLYSQFDARLYRGTPNRLLDPEFQPHKANPTHNVSMDRPKT